MICTPKVRQTFGGVYFYERKEKKKQKILARIQNICYNGYARTSLSYGETMRKYFPHLAPRGIGFLKQWERIYLEEGKVGFYIEKRGRSTKMDNPRKGRPRKKPLDKQVENDLIAELQKLKEENQYLRAENEYIKKLSALIAAEEQKKSKKQK